uniref:Uncharacterized protein n=1 Tax=Davidia involucrata TaxID=16924 RepID=A0A5B7BHW5_DAVIN
MSISIEALAMAGANYLESGMEIEEWERRDLETPPYLLAEAEDEIALGERKNIRLSHHSFHTGFLKPVDKSITVGRNNPSNDDEDCDDFDNDDDGVTVGCHLKVGLERVRDKKTFKCLRSIGMMVMCAIIRLLMILRTEIRKTQEL